MDDLGYPEMEQVGLAEFEEAVLEYCRNRMDAFIAREGPTQGDE